MKLITVKYEYFDHSGSLFTEIIYEKTFKTAMKKISAVHKDFLHKVSYSNKRGKNITIWFKNGKRIKRVWE